MDNNAKALFDAKIKNIESDLVADKEQIKRRYEQAGPHGSLEMQDRLGRAEAASSQMRRLAQFELEKSLTSKSSSTTKTLVPHKWLPNFQAHTGELLLLEDNEKMFFRSSYFGGLNEFFSNADLTTSRQNLKKGIATHTQGGKKNAGEVSITQWKSDLKEGHPEFFKYFEIVSDNRDIYKLQPK